MGFIRGTKGRVKNFFRDDGLSDRNGSNRYVVALSRLYEQAIRNRTLNLDGNVNQLDHIKRAMTLRATQRGVGTLADLINFISGSSSTDSCVRRILSLVRNPRANQCAASGRVVQQGRNLRKEYHVRIFNKMAALSFLAFLRAYGRTVRFVPNLPINANSLVNTRYTRDRVRGLNPLTECPCILSETECLSFPECAAFTSPIGLFKCGPRIRDRDAEATIGASTMPQVDNYFESRRYRRRLMTADDMNLAGTPNGPMDQLVISTRNNTRIVSPILIE